MAQIQKGTTYSTGDQVTATNLNALADAAILLPGAITDQTAKTVPLAADTVLIHSAADTALRKSTLTQLFSNATGIPLTTGVTGILPAANGGTGVNNGANTITIAGNVTHAGAFTQTFTATANTALTLPTTGTLATLAGSEALSNKTITASAFNGTVGATTPSTVSATTIAATSGYTANQAANTVSNGFLAVAVGGAINGGMFHDGTGLVLRENAVNIVKVTGSTGLAVTGALSATGASTIQNTFTVTRSISAARTLTLSLENGTADYITDAAGAYPHRFFVGATKYAQIDTTGLAVTGTSTSSGSMRITTNNVYYRGTTSGGAQQIILGIGADDNTAIVSKSGNTIKMDAGGSTVGTFSSTGLAVTGALSCTGALSKGSGSFRIEHPLPEKSATHQLVHSFIEGPQADLIYRGKVVLIDGKASVNIDAVATMTEGTFEVLCRDVQCFTTNESGWTAIRGKVTGNILTIEAKDADCTDEISWMVIGERKDPHMMETDWTDDNGKVIVEPLKPSIESN